MGRGPMWIFLQRRHPDGQETYEKMLNITDHQGDANQTTMNQHLTPVCMTVTKKTEITNVIQDVEKRRPLCTVGKNGNWCTHRGNSMEGPQKN